MTDTIDNDFKPEAEAPPTPPPTPSPQPRQQYYVPYQPPPKKKGGRSMLWIILGFIAAILILSSLFDGFGDFDSKLPSDKINIGVVDLIGPIEDSTIVVSDLNDFAKRDKIKAIILRIDSPGGGVGASQEIYREVERVKQVKPVVVSMGGLAASGGYYSAASADMIVANAGTITGSIGVIASTTYMRELIEFMKMDPVVYKSGKHKDMMSPFRRATEEDEALIMGMINDIYEQFVEDIAKGRNLNADDIRPIADGRVFTGREAMEYKLVDKIGNIMDAAEEAAKLANADMSKDIELVYPEEDPYKAFEKIFEGAANGVVRSMKSPGAKVEYRVE